MKQITRNDKPDDDILRILDAGTLVRCETSFYLSPLGLPTNHCRHEVYH